jgi:GH15 family glucan-1,4-alpha-glucosidase
VRVDGYMPIRDYAAIGDGRTVALVACDGSIDWLCLPNLDSPSVFASLLDRERGGRFELEPTTTFTTTRRYVPGTNVLETTFTTAEGVVRVTDAMTVPLSGLAPQRELARRVEGVAGTVPMRWRVEPRFDYGHVSPRVDLRTGVPVAAAGHDALAVMSWDAGEPEVERGAVGSTFTTGPRGAALIVLAGAHQEPLVMPSRNEVEARLEQTTEMWREWADGREFDGPWRDAVIRSALALRLLVFAPSGAIAAAPTTSLPEEFGGERNWDYRFSWPRDAAFTIGALLALGCAREARAFFSWILHASQRTHPHVQPLYRLDGRAEAVERPLALAGYRDSRPVRVGNAAAGQLQLDVYGELLWAASSFANADAGLDREHGRRLAELADFVAQRWREPDAGIWETRTPPKHFVQSKIMCAVALKCACELAEQGLVPAKNRGRWQSELHAIREFVEAHGFSESRRSYLRSVGEDELDAALLIAVNARYDEPRAPRLLATVDAIRDDLCRGALVHRYRGADGLEGKDGAFVACSFWLAEAYAHQERVDEATAVMEEVLALANDVGLFAEEVEPGTGEFLGNFPQGLSHVALINAAFAIERARA